MKLNYRQIEAALATILNLGQLEKAPVGVIRLAKLADVLEDEYKIYKKEKEKLWATVFGEDKEVPKEDPRVAEFVKDNDALLDVEVDVAVSQIKVTDLNLNINAISPNGLRALKFLFSDYENL